MASRMLEWFCVAQVPQLVRGLQAAALLSAVLLLATRALGEVFFEETFDDDSYLKRWTPSTVSTGAWAHTAGKFPVDEAANKGLQTTEGGAHCRAH